jgi:hypothetical protein
VGFVLVAKFSLLRMSRFRLSFVHLSMVLLSKAVAQRLLIAWFWMGDRKRRKWIGAGKIPCFGESVSEL